MSHGARIPLRRYEQPLRISVRVLFLGQAFPGLKHRCVNRSGETS